MIDEEWRYFAPSGNIFPRGPSTWNILDWDQRRIIAVTMDEFQDTEDIAIGHLRKHIDALPLDAYAVEFSLDGDLVSVSTDLATDQTLCPHYPLLSEISQELGLKTILRSKLCEKDRLGPNVDLVTYRPSEGSEQREVVFKYYFIFQFIEKRWDEMNLWMRVSGHPNIAPFDRIVTDKLDETEVIGGFTSLYIPNGTLSENKSRVFKLKYLKQLTTVVDDLNLKYGIAHQDVAARNLVIDPSTDDLLLFDFNFSAGIGGKEYFQVRNDVTGVVFTIYEIITRDEKFTEVPHEEQTTTPIEELDEWVKHLDVLLDHLVSEYQSFLNAWVRKRREGHQVKHYTDAPEYIDWPEMETPPVLLKSKDLDGTIFTSPWPSWTGLRRFKQVNGRPFLTWERPPQRLIRKDGCLLATGEVVGNESEICG